MTPILVAGVDSSTQSTKVVVVDAEDGKLVAQGHAGHEVRGEDGARESDPAGWLDALRAALAETGMAADIDAISVAGQQHGLVVLGADGNPLRPAMLWNDVRSAPDAAALVGQLGADGWAQRTGSVPLAAFTVSKWAWFRRNEPGLAAQVRAVRLPHDFITEALTGQPATDRGDASGSGWWSPSAGAYDDAILSLPEVMLEGAFLPPVLGPDTVAGTVSPAAAARFGLRAGIPVGPGTGDNMAAALALGCAPGTPVVSLGTSGTVFVASATPTADPSAAVAGFADATGNYLPLVCLLNCTLVVDRIAGWLGLDREDTMAAGEVVMLPYFDGERTPNLPNASGSIDGLRHVTDPRQILQAAYNGVVTGLMAGLDAIIGAGAQVDPTAPLVVVGGGARGGAWLETLARISRRAVTTPRVGELVAFGAAAQAASALEDGTPAAVAARWALTT